MAHRASQEKDGQTARGTLAPHELAQESSMTDPTLTHFDDQGRARMVDVGGKPTTDRFAKAAGRIKMSPATLTRIRDRNVEKGDVLAVARLAAIMAAKKTPDLIPLCHPLPLAAVDVDFRFVDECQLEVEVQVRVTGQTGAEMEALTAAATAALTVYDMCKSLDRGMEVLQLRLIEKWGGKSGHFRRDETTEDSDLTPPTE